MFLKGPKNDKSIYWTEHLKIKMRQYGLSESRLKRILRAPHRREKGIAPKTIALMQRAGSKNQPAEIWLMYQQKGQRKKIISAWRYPGISPVGEPIPVPQDIIEELKKN
ncbi:MAG: hypothetical protein A3A94_00695 [Candidatus Portnoybacteria bacterium RIFCSPLOWO2_01_FULL_43_11]|uniref:Uncharacterized protein n=3 Tax=Candidatus Portnoyibacteriota TaxID=1817913 RepID=A0A1G2FBC1_9BACT|nr:MAG: hypothetical protein A2815_01530 [Candidatus Portnoybacteria bacterium RIFCSPHIGHO2_01_FULL_40_12b]OGZ36666.1 MAG: hypothetical protein A3D38_00160 [Candidatus Portnoybacteria bacterium RIFCSPHIGHO2_02_FULL_40_23]OGZ38549.1 MAG: hypothetical protein A3A94_00695 [Candidatus Portnoybacteria bacterium RIFCSPLOWO2_01_FULL_43_11]OGZ40944.1 MAG: hypothetical protein A3I20_02895 [Candidatus Portnoybacteria bacterium RIFCSPLOWO2_02_FULL_40_15]